MMCGGRKGPNMKIFQVTERIIIYQKNGKDETKYIEGEKTEKKNLQLEVKPQISRDGYNIGD